MESGDYGVLTDAHTVRDFRETADSNVTFILKFDTNEGNSSGCG